MVYFDTPQDTLGKIKLDVLGQTVLQEIQKHQGFQNAVIAGGYIRDYILNGKFKDIDIFVPPVYESDITKFVSNLPEYFSLVNIRSTKSSRYRNSQVLTELIDLTYLDNIPIQIIISKISASDKFIDTLLESFDFGINQVASKGKELVYTKQFEVDVSYKTATLLVRMDSILELPKYMKRFLSLQEKYPNLSFAAKYLQVKDSSESKEKESKEIDYRSHKLIWLNDQPNINPQGYWYE